MKTAQSAGRTKHSVWTLAMLAAAVSGAAQAQTGPFSDWAFQTVISSTSQSMMGSNNQSAAFIKNGSTTIDLPKITSSTDLSILEFSNSTGVLLGMSATLGMTNPNSTFFSVVANNTNPLSANLTGSWTLGNFATANQSLLSYSSGVNDVQYTFAGPSLANVKDAGNLGANYFTANWSTLSLASTPASAQNLNSLVKENLNSSGQHVALTGTITSSAQVTIPVDKNLPIQTRITGSTDLLNVPADSTLAPGIKPIDPSMTANISYYYIGHSNASFSASVVGNINDTNDLAVDLSTANNSTFIDIFALGGAKSTTNLTYSGFNCLSNNCDGIIITPTFTNLTGGTQGQLEVTFDPSRTGTGEAIFELSFADAAGVGATASQRPNFLTLRVNTSEASLLPPQGGPSPVPEPHDTAMWLAGLGAIGWLSRRRGARGARRGQVLCA